VRSRKRRKCQGNGVYRTDERERKDNKRNHNREKTTFYGQGQDYLDSIIKFPLTSISMAFIILLHGSLNASIRRLTIPPLISPGERFHCRKSHPCRIKSPNLGLGIGMTVPEGGIGSIIFGGFACCGFFFSV